MIRERCACESVCLGVLGENELEKVERLSCVHVIPNKSCPDEVSHRSRRESCTSVCPSPHQSHRLIAPTMVSFCLSLLGCTLVSPAAETSALKSLGVCFESVGVCALVDVRVCVCVRKRRRDTLMFFSEGLATAVRFLSLSLSLPSTLTRFLNPTHSCT